MAELSIGERNKAWFRPGPGDDQDGPYQVRFRAQFGTTVTAWFDLILGTHPEGGVGFYVWAATADVPDAVGTDVILAAGDYLAQIRYTSGRLIDLSPATGRLSVG